MACENGFAGSYPCQNIDLLSHLDIEQLTGHAPHRSEEYALNDVWGWVSRTGKHYLIVGLPDRAVFVDVSEADEPAVVGYLPATQAGIVSRYRGIKVYRDYAFIIADTPFTAHGMQIFDLEELEGAVYSADTRFAPTAHYDGIQYGHNLWINTQSGYGYILRSDTCGAAAHVVDLRNPLQPQFVACLTTDGADSDAECVVYEGPDEAYRGREICVIGSDSAVTIGEVASDGATRTVARLTYPNITRAHQGAFASGQRYWVLSDINDEDEYGFNTRTHLLDLHDLDSPRYLGYFEQPTASGDHNLYIQGNWVYQTNWTAGLRIYDLRGLPALNWPLVGYFDTYPANDHVGHHGAFSNYPFLPNGVVAISDSHGLYLVKVRLEPTDVVLSADSLEFTAQSWPIWGFTVASLTLLFTLFITIKRK